MNEVWPLQSMQSSKIQLKHGDTMSLHPAGTCIKQLILQFAIASSITRYF